MINLDKVLVKRIMRSDLLKQRYDESYEVDRIYVPIDESKQVENVSEVIYLSMINREVVRQ